MTQCLRPQLTDSMRMIDYVSTNALWRDITGGL